MFEVYEAKDGEWRWRLVGANGEKMAQATEGYRDKTDADRAVQDVVEAVLDSLAGTHHTVHGAPELEEIQ